MFRNFIKSATRYILNYQIFTIINVLGLTIGLASSLLIYLYISRELSYDKFHSDYDRIYRIGVHGSLKGAELNQAISALPMANTLKADFDDIEEVVRVGRYGAWLVTYNNQKYNEDNLIFADSAFFNLFSFRLIKGDPQTALSKPNSILLTEATAYKYFGKEDPMGKMMNIENDTTFYRVTGILEDVPANSHIKFDMLASFITLKNSLPELWVSHNVYTYFKVKEGSNPEVLKDSINRLVDKYVLPQLNEVLGMNPGDFESAGNSYNFFLQPLADIHLKSNLNAELEQNGNITFIYIFTVLAILIIIIASINFMNLSTARAAQRAKEVGIRKIAGSDRMLLIRQFLTESVLVSILAMTMALLVVEIVLPQFNNYIDLNLDIRQLANWRGIILLFVSAVIVGLLAGSYPACFLASYNPVTVLQRWVKNESGHIRFRKGLVFFQFFVSIFFLIVTFVLFEQYKYLVNKDPGFEKKNLLIIRRSDAIKNNIENFKKDILTNPNVKAVSYSNTIPGKQFMKSSFMIDGASSEITVLMNILFVSSDFHTTYGLNVLEGKFFPDDLPADSLFCVVNETAAKLITEENIVGRKLRLPTKTDNGEKKKDEYKVIGVINDFNFASLEESIGPLVLLKMHENWEGYFTVNILSADREETAEFLKEKWEKYTPVYPFVHYMLNDELNSGYHLIRKTARIFSVFSFITIFVAFMGLYGLVSFTSNLKIKEIGMRKVLGASLNKVIFLLVKDTIILISIAALLSGIITFLSARWWLTDFHYHIRLKPDYFISSIIIVLILASVIVVLKVYGSAKINPGKVLKYE